MDIDIDIDIDKNKYVYVLKWNEMDFLKFTY